MRPLQVFYSIDKQDNKIKLFKKWKIYNIFLVLLLDQDIISKKWIDKYTTRLNASNNNKKYKINAI